MASCTIGLAVSVCVGILRNSKLSIEGVRLGRHRQRPYQTPPYTVGSHRAPLGVAHLLGGRQCRDRQARAAALDTPKRSPPIRRVATRRRIGQARRLINDANHCLRPRAWLNHPGRPGWTSTALLDRSRATPLGGRLVQHAMVRRQPGMRRGRHRRAAASHRRRHPQRLRGEAAFAHLYGVASIPASSGRTHRHREVHHHLTDPAATTPPLSPNRRHQHPHQHGHNGAERRLLLTRPDTGHPEHGWVMPLSRRLGCGTPSPLLRTPPWTSGCWQLKMRGTS
jgi:hypothetical protein